MTVIGLHAETQTLDTRQGSVASLQSRLDSNFQLKTKTKNSVIYLLIACDVFENVKCEKYLGTDRIILLNICTCDVHCTVNTA